MAYPAKTDREAILSAALEQVERSGLEGMSLRGLASELGLAPNALYRYFADRAALESALHAEAARRLHQAMKRAVGKKQPAAAIRALADCYLRFAREHRNLCVMMVTPVATLDEDAAAQDALWEFVVAEVARLTPAEYAPDAAVALWMLLQGAVALEMRQALSERRPASGLEFALEAWLAAARAKLAAKSSAR